MEIKVRATQYDLDTKEATILADGKAFLNLDTLFYREKDHPESAQQITFRSGGEVILQRRGNGEGFVCFGETLACGGHASW